METTKRNYKALARAEKSATKFYEAALAGNNKKKLQV